MKKRIEFTWNNKYIHIFNLIFFAVFKDIVSDTSKKKVKKNYKNTVTLFELITECCQIFTFSLFFIEKLYSQNKKKNVIEKIKKKKKKSNLMTYYIYITILIFITSLFKFNFTIFNYHIFNKFLYKIHEFSTYYINSIMMISFFSLLL